MQCRIAEFFAVKSNEQPAPLALGNTKRPEQHPSTEYGVLRIDPVSLAHDMCPVNQHKCITASST